MVGGEKTIRFSKPLPAGQEVTEKLGKQKEGRFRSTDLILSVASLALSELVTKTKDAEKMLASVPFSLRGFPETKADFDYHNDFACVPFWINFPKNKETKERVFVYDKDGKLDKSLLKETALGAMSALSRRMKTSRAKFESIGWYYMMKYFIFLLRVPLAFKPKTIASYYHTVLSIVPGSRKTLSVGVEAEKGGDLQVTELAYAVPGMGRVTCGISAITNGDNIQIGIMCDKSQFTEGRADKFIKIYEELFTEIVKSLD